MANLLSVADGNFTNSATWAIVDSTFLISTSTGQTALTTSALDSTAFQPGAITVDGIAIKLASRATGTPTNKITVTLRNSSAGSDVKSVTANVSDLPACDTTNLEGGWHFFKFDASVLLLAATNYVVRILLDSTSTAVSIATNGTANNWQHMLRQTTTAAPAAGDDLFVLGEFNGAANPATTTARSVTMDSTSSATQYGANATESVHTPSLSIGTRGTVAYGTTASTNYYLKIAGDVIVFSGGTLTIGTTGTPVPRSGSAILEFVTASSKLYQLIIKKGATFTAQGLSRTSAKNVWNCNLSANLAAAGTTFNVDADTGWLSGDEVVVASTTRTGSEAELRILNADAGASSFVVTAGVTNAHGGSAPVVAEVILITRNVKIRASNTSFSGIIQFLETATVDVDWVEIRNMGTQIWTLSTGSCNIQFSSWRNDGQTVSAQIDVRGAASDSFTVQNCSWFISSTSIGISTVATTGTAWTLSTLIGIHSGNGVGYALSDLSGTLDYLTCAGSGGFNLIDSTAGLLTIQGTPHFTCHSCSAGPAVTGRFVNTTFASLNFWRNSGTPSFGTVSTTDFMSNVTITSLTCFGNSVTNFTIPTGQYHRCRILGGLLAADTTFSVTNGMKLTAAAVTNAPLRQWTFDNLSFGVVTGIYTSHTNDVDFSSTVEHIQFTFRNCLFSSANTFVNYTSLLPMSFIASARHNQISNGSHLYVTPVGTISADTVTYKTASPSEKMAPISASVKLESGQKQIALANAAGCTVAVWVRKNAAYNGNAPRLIQKADPAIGVNSDTVLDTFSVGADTWEQLSGSIPAASDNAAATVVVDCDGTLGNVFVDDWTAT